MNNQKFTCQLKIMISVFVMAFFIQLQSQTYCSTSYASGTGSGDYISLVQIPSTTLNSSSAGAASPYYTLFAASGSTTATLVRGNTTPYTLKFAGGTTATCYIAAWGDWNHNGVFEANEYLGVSTNAGNSTTVTFANGINVPDSAIIGTTRIRFRSSSISPGSTSTESCNATNSGNGETEDYIVTISCQFTSAPSASFFIGDSVFVKSPFLFLNNNLSHFVTNQWYINGAYQTNTRDFKHTFVATGTYNICLKSTNCFGSDSTCSSITVFNPTMRPIVDFVTDKDTALVSNYIVFNDLTAKGPVYWKWTVTPSKGVTFLFGTSDSSENPVINFDQSGQYQVCLWDSNAIGRSSTKCKTIVVVHKMCIYPFDATEASGELVSINVNNGSGTCSFLIDACASSINIKFPIFDFPASSNLRIYNGTNNSAPHLFPGPGFTGTILPGGAIGITASSGKMLIEYNASTNAKFHATWTSIPSNEPPPSGKIVAPDTLENCGALTEFRYVSSNPLFDYTEAYYTWNFEYGSGYIPPPLPKGYYYDVNWGYLYTGTYIIRLDITNCGGTETIYDTVVVIHPVTGPPINFKANMLTATPADIVTLTDISKREQIWWQWTITGPGSITAVNGNSNSKYYGIKFNTPGSYTVQLKDSNCAASSTLIKTAYINIVDYCVPYVGTLNPDFCIQHFVMGRVDTIINNTITGLDFTNTNPTVGTTTYRDNTNAVTNYTVENKTFTNKSVEAVVAIGDSIYFNITRLNNFNKVNFKIWIDYNQDGIFQASELAAASGSTPSISYAGYLTIPLTAKTGATRLRIGTSLDANSNTPCGLNSFGDFNDFRIKILPGIKIAGNIDSVFVEVGRVFTDPGTTVFGATTVVHSGIAYGTTISSYPSLNVHTITAYDAIENTSIKRIYIRATADTTKPLITKTGADTVYSEILVAYNDLGATANDFYFGSLTSYLVITSTVNINFPGTYSVKYNVKDAAGNSAKEVTRIVVVSDTHAPVVTLNGADTVIVNVKTLTIVPEPGYTIVDNYYPLGALTININYTAVNLNLLGYYKVRYVVSDPSGNMDSSGSRIYHVVDTTAPVITLIGNSIINWKHWIPYIDPGNTVTDNYYINLICTPDTSSVEYNFEGIYFVTFNVTDPSGNKAKQVQRIVHIIPNGIDDKEDNMAFSIYPNPNNGFINIVLNKDFVEAVRIIVIDANGKMVYQYADAIASNNKLQLDLSKEATGIYFIQIVTNKFSASKTFSIQK